MTFSQDAEGNWGYKPEGADTVIPFNGTLIEYCEQLLSYWKFFYLANSSVSSINFTKSDTDLPITISGSCPKGSGVNFGYIIYPYIIDFKKINSITITYEQHTTNTSGSLGDINPCWLVLYGESTVLSNFISNIGTVSVNPPSQQTYGENIMFEETVCAEENLGSPKQKVISIDEVSERGYIGFCFRGTAGNGYGNNGWVRLSSVILNR